VNGERGVPYRRVGVSAYRRVGRSMNGERRTVNGERAMSTRPVDWNPKPRTLNAEPPCFRQARSYCDLVKNITVSLPDEVYRKARVKAAERNTSLSAMVKQFLESLAEEEGEFKRLERLQEESYAQIERFQASNRLTREELYRRGNVR
jgi:plasmid stability protein